MTLTPEDRSRSLATNGSSLTKASATSRVRTMTTLPPSATTPTLNTTPRAVHRSIDAPEDSPITTAATIPAPARTSRRTFRNQDRAYTSFARTRRIHVTTISLLARNSTYYAPAIRDLRVR
jgi:hypothetical protein